jgi:hypothetical protein
MTSSQIAKATTSVMGRDLSLVRNRGPHLTNHAAQRTQERQILSDEVRWVFSHGDRYNLADNIRQIIIHKDKTIGVIINRQTNAIITVIPDVELEMWLGKRKKKNLLQAKKGAQEPVDADLKMSSSEIWDSSASEKLTDNDQKAPSLAVTLNSEDEWKECAYCKAKGHLIKECMAFYDPERSEPKKAKNRSNTECRYCHKNTHLIKECPKLTRKILEKKKRESRENAARKLQESLSSIGYTMIAHG